MIVQTEQTPRPSKEASVPDTEGLAQRRTGLPVRTGTRIPRTKSTMKGGEEDMKEKTFLTVDEVAEILSVLKSKAYEIVRQLNKEMKAKGFITVAARVSKTYFNERMCYSKELGNCETR